MFREVFFKQFDELTRIPFCAAQLRELILQLAVRGKLVSQDEGDQFSDAEFTVATSFVENIRGKKTKALNTHKTTKNMPRGWIATSLGNVVELVNGRAFKPTDWTEDGLKIVRIQNLNNPGAAFNHFSGEVRDRFLINTDDVLVSWSGTPGTSFGAYTWSGEQAILNQHIFRADFDRSVLDPSYIRLAVNAIMNDLISDAVGSAGLQHVRRGQIENSLFKIPPLTEQKRIVTKFEQLMELCSDLDARQAATTSVKRAYADAIMHSLSIAGEQDEIGAALSSVSSAFLDLFDDARNIGSLRETILDLAYTGAFCDEKPKIVRLEEGLVFGPKNGYSPKPVDYETGIRSIALSAITKGWFDQTKFKYLDEEIDENSHLWLMPGDILIQRANSIDHVGVSAIYSGEEGDFIYPDLIMKLRTSSTLLPEYVVYCLQSPTVRNYFRENATGTSGSMPKINQAVVKATPIPLVSRDAQKATIRSATTLMRLCDQLEEQVRKNDQLGSELLASLVHFLTTPDPDDDVPALDSVTPVGAAVRISAPVKSSNTPKKQSSTKRVQITRPSIVEKHTASAHVSDVDNKFKEAILVGAIVNAFFSKGGEPIGNFRLQKAVYFARRHNGEHVEQMEYLKKAAGPYNPSMKYSGGIAIAKQKNWLHEARGRFGFGHVPGAAAREIDEWVTKYGYAESALWVTDHFRFKKNEEWEILATVDYAMEHLRSLGIDPDSTQVLDYIRSDDEWRPKIEKLRLTEVSVGSAMVEIGALFGTVGEED